MAEQESSKRNWLGILKKGGIFMTILAVFLLAVSYGLFEYKQWRGKQGVKNLAEMFKKIEKDNYQRAMADTYGGKTPQETLQMYIDAVEKGDYELASKYFIEDYQWKGLANLNNKSQEGVGKYVVILKKSIKSIGGYYPRDYMPGGEEFIIDDPIYIRMRIYPNGIWKIIEI